MKFLEIDKGSSPRRFFAAVCCLQSLTRQVPVCSGSQIFLVDFQLFLFHKPCSHKKGNEQNYLQDKQKLKLFFIFKKAENDSFSEEKIMLGILFLLSCCESELLIMGFSVFVYGINVIIVYSCNSWSKSVFIPTIIQRLHNLFVRNLVCLTNSISTLSTFCEFLICILITMSCQTVGLVGLHTGFAGTGVI